MPRSRKPTRLPGSSRVRATLTEVIATTAIPAASLPHAATPPTAPSLPRHPLGLSGRGAAQATATGWPGGLAGDRARYSTVTDLARLLGRSGSQPRSVAT